VLLHLVRHGDAASDVDGGGNLTPAGRRQAALLGARLAGTTFAGVRTVRMPARRRPPP
jgi:broad specificity phosphatase PhoE